MKKVIQPFRKRFSESFFWAAAVFAAAITAEILMGERLSRRYPASIDRVAHAGLYLIPLTLAFVGWILRVRENKR